MQNCFVEGRPTSAPDGPVFWKRLNKLTDTCRGHGVQGDGDAMD